MNNPIAIRRIQSLKSANEIVIERLERTLAVARALVAQGYVLVPGGVNVNAARPVLQVHGDAKCRSHIEAGRAAYYHAGMGEFGRYRVGQWLFEECHVIWSEAGR